MQAVNCFVSVFGRRIFQKCFKNILQMLPHFGNNAFGSHVDSFCWHFAWHSNGFWKQYCLLHLPTTLMTKLREQIFQKIRNLPNSNIQNLRENWKKRWKWANPKFSAFFISSQKSLYLLLSFMNQYLKHFRSCPL